MRFKVASRVRGLSDEAFREAFGTEEQCRTALVRLRWPDGFVCPCCGHREHCVLAGRGLYQCNRCKKQTSPTAGTIFHATKLPLTLWFAAIHLIVTAKKGISSVERGRRLGVKQPTAWAVKHKIMAVMARREGETALTGRVEVDDAYLGGVRSGGKRGRGAAGKTPFVAAVSTSPEGRPRKLKLAPVKGFRKREIARGAVAPSGPDGPGVALHPQVQVYCDEINAIEVPPLAERPLDEIREGFHDLIMAAQATGVDVGRVEDRDIPGPNGPIRIRLYWPEGVDAAEPLPVYVNYHGSGYVVLSIDTHDGACRALCKGAGCIVVGVDYCKAPENKFPKPTEDAWASLKWVSRELRRDRRATRRASRSAAIRRAAASRR